MLTKERILVKDKEYSMEIHRERRNSARVSIGKRGVIIRIPRFMSWGEQERIISQMREWAIKKLEKRPLMQEEIKKYSDGETMDFWGQKYLLSIIVENRDRNSVRIKDNNLRFFIMSCLPVEEQMKYISMQISRCVSRKRLPHLKEKIKVLNAKHFNGFVKNVRFKNTSSRWGSCSSKGNINISTRLLFAPEEVLDYVCIHELAHLIEPNHSERFWALVERAMPDYKNKVNWLKENGHFCRF